MCILKAVRLVQGFAWEDRRHYIIYSVQVTIKRLFALHYNSIHGLPFNYAVSAPTGKG